MLKRFALPLALILPAAAFAQDAPAEPAPRTVDVVFETEQGDITMALEVERAPITAGNFLRYVDNHRFDGTVFYRAMRLDWGEQPNGLLQGGTQNDPKRIMAPIAHEPTSETGLTHDVVGALSMARNEPGTATGDFSIMVSPQPGLDADPKSEDENFRLGYAVFGRVTDGMEVVRTIFDSPVDPEKGEGWMRGQILAQPVKIIRAHRVDAAGGE
ncbi:peptidyl-prolyl cis-trans isomerase [Altererythrobacter sp. B11]|uniref:peptidylprolyl isomerase n=1 Tax=Altererythrobacter sp. B11 TaxID=2060312 RepID=UPI000DC7144B|nr:peptidylprolyl isomerase [Altererythrobacter sp. B11]BBC72469.1 peptidyl-prolyl cis-trans isomerase [Altererythrobacter sp. B11]